MKFVNSKQLKKRKILNIIFVCIAIVAVAVIVALFFAKNWYQQQLQPVSLQSQTQTVEIAKGATADSIAKILKDKQLIRNSQAFIIYLRLHGLRESLQAGSYEIDSSNTVPQIANVIAGGKVQTNLFTILPGQRIDQIKAAMVKYGYSEAVVNAAFGPELYKNHPALIDKPSGQSLEGYLYPESFVTTANTTPEEIIRKSLDEMGSVLTADLKDSFAKQGLTVHQAVTLGSIVDKEVSDTTQKPIVASVFYNRLKIGMVLGSDVTYQYIAKILGVDPTPFIESPYNTRKYAGLPPGPISNVSKSGLIAVANPASTDYLFFVAGDDGKVYYSKTNAEHEALARQHCIKLCSTY